MSHKHNQLKKFVSSFLVFSFLSMEFLYAAPEVGINPALSFKPIELISKDPTRFEAPLDFSSLKEIHKGSNSTFIIHIQDAHSNLSGQQNLAGALDEIMKKYEISLVLVEGGAIDGTLDSLKKIAPPEIVKRTAKRLLFEGEIAGEEYLNLTSDHPMKIMGIEDMSLYMKSVENYSQLADKREAVLNYLRRIQQATDKLKTKLYPKELLELEKAENKHQKNSFETDFQELSGLTSVKKIDLTHFQNVQKLQALQEKEKTIDFNLANLEQAALVDEIQKRGGAEDLKDHLIQASRMKNQKLSQLAYFQNIFEIAKKKNVVLSKYPNLVLYGEYLKDFSLLDLDQMLDELERLEDQIYKSFLTTQDQRLIRSIDRYLELLHKAYSIQMSSREFGLFQINEPDFATVSCLAFLNRKLIDLGYFEDPIPYQTLLEDGKKALEAFYQSVDERDLAFIRNTEKILKDQKQKVAILISGGYHTQNLTKLFKEKDYSFAVLTPLVTSETNQKHYEKLLLSTIQKEAKKAQTVSGEGRETNTEKVRYIQAAYRGVVNRFAQIAGVPFTDPEVRKARDHFDELRLEEEKARQEATQKLETAFQLPENLVLGARMAADDPFWKIIRGEPDPDLIKKFKLPEIKPIDFNAVFREALKQLGEKAVEESDQQLTEFQNLLADSMVLWEKINNEYIGREDVLEAVGRNLKTRLDPWSGWLLVQFQNFRRVKLAGNDRDRIRYRNMLISWLPQVQALHSELDRVYKHIQGARMAENNPLTLAQVYSDQNFIEIVERLDLSNSRPLLTQGKSGFSRRDFLKTVVGVSIVGAGVASNSNAQQSQPESFTPESKAAWKSILERNSYPADQIGILLSQSPRDISLFLTRELAKAFTDSRYTNRVARDRTLYANAAVAISTELKALMEGFITRLDLPVAQNISFLDGMNEKFFGPVGVLVEYQKSVLGDWEPILHVSDKLSDVEVRTIKHPRTGEDTSVVVIYGKRADGESTNREGFRLGKIRVAFVDINAIRKNAEVYHRLMRGEIPIREGPMKAYLEATAILLRKDFQGLTVDQIVEKVRKSVIENELLHTFETAWGIVQEGDYEMRSNLNQILGGEVTFYDIANIAAMMMSPREYALQAAKSLDIIYERAIRKGTLRAELPKETLTDAVRAGDPEKMFNAIARRLRDFATMKASEIKDATKEAYPSDFPIVALRPTQTVKPLLELAKSKITSILKEQLEQFRNQRSVSEAVLNEVLSEDYWAPKFYFQKSWAKESIETILKPAINQVKQKYLGDKAALSDRDRFRLLELAIESLSGKEIQEDKNPPEEVPKKEGWFGSTLLISTAVLTGVALIAATYYLYKRRNLPKQDSGKGYSFLSPLRKLFDFIAPHSKKIIFGVVIGAVVAVSGWAIWHTAFKERPQEPAPVGVSSAPAKPEAPKTPKASSIPERLLKMTPMTYEQARKELEQHIEKKDWVLVIVFNHETGRLESAVIQPQALEEPDFFPGMLSMEFRGKRLDPVNERKVLEEFLGKFPEGEPKGLLKKNLTQNEEFNLFSVRDRVSLVIRGKPVPGREKFIYHSIIEIVPINENKIPKGARLALSKKAIALLAAIGIGIIGTATYFVLPKNKEAERPAVVAVDENRVEFMVAQLTETVMTYDEIDRHIDTIPKNSRPGLGFILRRVRGGEWEFAISLQAKERRVNLTNVTGFTPFNGDIYVRHLDEERGMAPTYGRASIKEGFTEIEEEKLPLEVRKELGIMKYSQMDRYIDAPHMFPTNRPGISFRLDEKRQDGVLHIHFGEVGRFKREEAAPSKTFDNVAGFTVFGGDVYVKRLDEKNNYLPQYFRITKDKDVKELSKGELSTRVQWDFGLLHIKNPPGIVTPEIKQLGLKSIELKRAVVRQDIVTPALGENKDSETVLKETTRFIASKFSKHHSYVSGKLNDSETVVIALEPDQGDQNYYQNFRLFVGKPGTTQIGFLQELKIDGVERLRDGGTTIIKAGENVFYIERFTWQPTLNGKKIDIYIKGDGARLAEDLPEARIQTIYEVRALLPSRQTSEIGVPLGNSLPLIVAAQPQGVLLPVGVSPVGVVPAMFVGIGIMQKTNGSIAVQLGQGSDPIQVTRADIQLAGSRLATVAAAQRLPKVYELKTEPQEIAVDAYQEQDKRTAQLFRQMVNRLTENKFAIFRFSVDDEEQQIVDNIAKEMAEFKAELDRLNQGATFVFKARFELAGKNGNLIQQLETAEAMTQAESANAAQFRSSVENQAFLDEAKTVKAGYLPTEGIYVGGEIRVFNYKAIGRTGLAVVTDSPSAPQMIEALTGADMSRTDVAKTNLQLVKAPHTIPDVSIQTYRKQNLVVRALAKLAQQLYQAYVTLRAAGTSA